MLPDGRIEIEERLREVTERFRGTVVPCPPHWGGFRLVPVEFEFWQGRESRLHDRIRYLREHDGAWVVSRLSP